MNANQRVKTVFSREIPDRVPIGEFAIDFDTVEKIIGRPTYLRANAKSKLAFWENRHESGPPWSMNTGHAVIIDKTCAAFFYAR